MAIYRLNKERKDKDSIFQYGRPVHLCTPQNLNKFVVNHKELFQMDQKKMNLYNKHTDRTFNLLPMKQSKTQSIKINHLLMWKNL